MGNWDGIVGLWDGRGQCWYLSVFEEGSLRFYFVTWTVGLGVSLVVIYYNIHHIHICSILYEVSLRFILEFVR